ncbi:MAG TPA: amino acid ABC transporter substrate-binding protein [Candidatus Dormibacteraeota bacterium]|nr:amino acid ABC transporter substrate-binding protein [Candidatus Dormibacteraeota bacterium]
MKSHLRRLIAAGAMAGLMGLVLAACGSTTTNKPITIGISLSLSGDFSADGQAYQRGYELWASYVNAHGGILGRKVKLDIVSDASSPTQVDTNYTKLITLDKVNLVFGPFSTLLTVPASKVANRYGYAFVEGAGGAPSAFANGLKNIFDVSLPVADYMVPFVNWIKSLPASERPKTAAYPTSNDPFTEPVIEKAKSLLQAAGVKTVYDQVFPAEDTDYAPIAQNVAATHADIVVLGSVDVPTVSAFMQAFEQDHYNPKAFIAAAGPDQGSAFVSAVGAANTDGSMVPGGWSGTYDNAESKAMVKMYIAKYGGTPAGVNADVAEAYSVGQVVEQAVEHNKSLSNAKIINYLHSGVTLNSVQGQVQFDSKGENGKAVGFIFQWQGTAGTVYKQVLPKSDPSSVSIVYPKPDWGS